MKAIDRIYQYIDYHSIKVVDFERKNFISNGYLAKMKLRGAGIGEDILKQIIENCPDLSPAWLLTGEGEMLRNAPAPSPSPVSLQSQPCALCKEKDKVIASQEKTIKILEEANAELKFRNGAATPSGVAAPPHEELSPH